MHNLLIRCSKTSAFVSVVAFGPIEDLPSTFFTVYGGFCSCHFFSLICSYTQIPRFFRTVLMSAELTSAASRDFRFRFGDFASARWFRFFLARFSFPFEVFLNRFAELLCVFIFGI
tara:strand:- start:144993 stop:145340 length:348 start_codon:yes stop_codon:yes gene_type:complete